MNKRIVSLILAGSLMLPTSSFAMMNDKPSSTNGNISVKQVSTRQHRKEVKRISSRANSNNKEFIKEHKRNIDKEDVKDKFREDMKHEFRDDMKDEIEEKMRREMQEKLKHEIKDNMREEMKHRFEKEMKEKLKQEIRQELKEEEKEVIKEEIRKEMIEKMKKDMREKLTKEVKKERREQIKALKEAAKEAYNQEELVKIEETIKELKEAHPNVKVLPVQNIISKKMNFKFDTPPVIKEGRTLLPVRAIAEGLKADILWHAGTNEVTITKDGKNIILKIDSNVAIVDGKEVELDSKAEIMSGRTVIPVRFVAENLGLKVKWDSEEESIEIAEEGSQTIDEAINKENIEKELENELVNEIETINVEETNLEEDPEVIETDDDNAN